jgi:O-succinylbenzoic acid--CoA ligase
MTDSLDRRAQDEGGAVFLESRQGRLTYREAEALVSGRARALGDRSGSQVVVEPRLDLESVVELLAVPRSGATMVVIGPDRPDSGTLREMAASELRPSHSILFTSGSSGSPRGVRLSKDNWRAAAQASRDHLQHRPGDRWLCVLPLHHVGGLIIIHRMVAVGGRVILEPDLPQARARLAEVEWASLVPTQLYRILRMSSSPLTNSPRVLVGGGPVEANLIGAGLAAGLEVLPSYGMTETTSQAATARTPGGPLVPLPGIEIRIGPEDRIELRGDTVMLGYVGRPEVEGWLTTNDRGRINPDRTLSVVGRLDRVIVTGGEKVDPVQVEEALSQHPRVKEVAVIGLPDPEWGERVAVAVVGEVDPGELEDFLRSRLPGHARPRLWLGLEALPRTELGKVDAARLRRLFP